MILNYKRDRQKELAASGASLRLLGVLNAVNIQHFYYDTDNHTLMYTLRGMPRVLPCPVPPHTLDLLCTISTKVDESLANVTLEPYVLEFLLKKAGYSDIKQAKADCNKKSKLEELKKRLESGNY